MMTGVSRADSSVWRQTINQQLVLCLLTFQRETLMQTSQIRPLYIHEVLDFFWGQKAAASSSCMGFCRQQRCCRHNIDLKIWQTRYCITISTALLQGSSRFQKTKNCGLLLLFSLSDAECKGWLIPKEDTFLPNEHQERCSYFVLGSEFFCTFFASKKLQLVFHSNTVQQTYNFQHKCLIKDHKYRYDFLSNEVIRHCLLH